MKVGIEEDNKIDILKQQLRMVSLLKVSLWMKVKRLGPYHPEVLEFHAEFRSRLESILKEHDYEKNKK